MKITSARLILKELLVFFFKGHPGKETTYYRRNVFVFKQKIYLRYHLEPSHLDVNAEFFVRWAEWRSINAVK